MPPEVIAALTNMGPTGIITVMFYFLHTSARKEYIQREERLVKTIETLSLQSTTALADNNKILSSIERLLDDRLGPSR
jgi:hypothetical protein